MSARRRQLNVILTDEEWRAMSAAAESSGLRLNTWARTVLRVATGLGGLRTQLAAAARVTPQALRELFR